MKFIVALLALALAWSIVPLLIFEWPANMMSWLGFLFLWAAWNEARVRR